MESIVDYSCTSSEDEAEVSVEKEVRIWLYFSLT